MIKIPEAGNRGWKISFIFILFSPLIFIYSCAGQSIVGKWKQISGKMYCTPEGIVKSHGHMKEIMDMPKIDAVDEFRSDNTLIETITSGGKTTTNTGKWVMSGKAVTITVNGNPPMGGVYSASDNMLVFTLQMPPSANMAVSKREWTYARL